MRPLRMFSLALCLAAGVLVAACGRPAAESNDIPITTASDEAREAFIEGRAAFEVGRTDDARALFDKAIAADASFAMAYMMRARCGTSAPDWKHYADLAVANRENASPGEQKLVDMLTAIMENDLDKELDLAQQLVKEFPKSARAHQTLAETYDGMQNVAEARREMEEAMTLDPSWPVPQRALASSYVFEDPRDLAKAQKYAAKYVELKPEEADAHIMLGDVYRAEVNLEQARVEYKKAAEADPSSSVALTKKGHVETFLGNFDAARADFDKAAETAKTWKVGAKNFGVYTWLYAGDPAAALTANQAVIDDIAMLTADENQQKQALASCYEDRCRIACEAGDFDLAADAFTKHAAIRRHIAANMNNAAFTKSNEMQLAELEGLMAVSKGDYAAAVTMADKAEEAAQGLNNPGALNGVHYLRGIIALREGNPQAALKHFQASSNDWITVKYYTALAQEALGDMETANALFKEVADWDFNGLEYALIRNKAIAKLAS